MTTARPLLVLLAGLMFVFNSACSSIPVEERAQKREDINQAAEETIGPGDFTFFVTAYGEADAMLNPDEAVSLVRGQRLDDARNRLVANLPLAKEPQITHWPDWPEQLEWLERMPLLSLRIDVKVESPIEAAAQAR